MFEALFAAHPDIDLIPYDLTAGVFPRSVEECDGWVTTGSRRGVYEDEHWIRGLAQLVREVVAKSRPFVGVCFGHQMVAQALGGSVAPAAMGWGVGVKTVEVADPPAWLPLPRFRILNSHADQIVRPPRQAIVLGGNDHCPVSLMAVGDTVVGLQGHPEFPVEYCEALIRARRGSVIPEDVSDAALASLAEPPDRLALADGLASFLRGRVGARPRGEAS
jgi:GMP synthase-like glutamine amidotransferase